MGGPIPLPHMLTILSYDFFLENNEATILVQIEYEAR